MGGIRARRPATRISFYPLRDENFYFWPTLNTLWFFPANGSIFVKIQVKFLTIGSSSLEASFFVL